MTTLVMHPLWSNVRTVMRTLVAHSHERSFPSPLTFVHNKDFPEGLSEHSSTGWKQVADSTEPVYAYSLQVGNAADPASLWLGNRCASLSPSLL